MPHLARGPRQPRVPVGDERLCLQPRAHERRPRLGAGRGVARAEPGSLQIGCLISHAGLVNLESQWGTSDFVYNHELMNGGPVWEQGAVWREQNPVRYRSDASSRTRASSTSSPSGGRATLSTTTSS